MGFLDALKYALTFSIFCLACIGGRYITRSSINCMDSLSASSVIVSGTVVNHFENLLSRIAV